LSKGAVAGIGLPTHDELLEVIRRPFEEWGAPLDGPAHALLRSRLTAFLRDANAEGDVLPLISLQLTHLYEAIRTDVDKRIKRSRRLEASGATVTIQEREVADHIDFGSVIADAAMKAVNEVRTQPGLLWNEDEVDGLFDRLVELRDRAAESGGNSPLPKSPRDPLLLKSEPLPDRLTLAREVAGALAKRRLLVDLGRTRYRLVHEVVAWQWPRFADWLTRRRDVLETVRELRPLHELYQKANSQSRRALLTYSVENALGAARILLEYADVLGPQNEDYLDAATRSRRDFYIDLIAAHPQIGPTPIESVKRDHAEQKKTLQTPVAHVVAYYRRPDVMRTLLAADPAVAHSVRRPDERSILVPATIAADHETVSLLIEKGTNPISRERAGEGWSPVSVAAYLGDQRLFEQFVALGANPLERLSDGWSTLHIVADRNHPHLLRHIVRTSPPEAVGEALVTDHGLTAAHIAAQRGHVDVLAALAETGPASILDEPVSGGGSRPLALAAAGGHAAAVAWLAARSDVQIDAVSAADEGRSALMIAAGLKERGADIASTLLNTGRCDANLQAVDSRQTALHMAAAANNPSVVRRLLAHPGIDPNVGNGSRQTPLFVAVANHRSGIVDLLLLDSRVDPFIPDNTGRSVLLLAHEQKELPLIATLLSRLPDSTDRAEPDGWTPLLLAATHDRRDHFDRFWRGRGDRPIDDVVGREDAGSSQDLVSILVERGQSALVTRALADRRVAATPVWPKAFCDAAKRPDRLDILQLLLQDPRFDRNSPVSYGTDLGKRPVHYAAITGNVAGLRLLIESGGVTADETDQWQRTPADCSPTSVRPVILALTRKEASAAAHADVGAVSEPHVVPAQTASGMAEGEDLNALERAAVLSRISKVNDLDFTMKETTFRKRQYSFYPGCTLVEVSNPHWTFGVYVRAYLMVIGAIRRADSEVVRLDGTSLPIHQLNARMGVTLSPDTAVEYLKFFCYFVWGAEGPFYVIPEDTAPSYIAEDTRVDPGESGTYGTLRDLYRPPALHGQDADGTFRASALVYYADAIFFAEFLINRIGEVEMVEDEPLISGLGVKVDVPAPHIRILRRAALQAGTLERI
jgi:ankyrin repeat protein